jgi:DNA repair protein RecO (recombination protein O)
MLERTEAVVLRTKPFSEADLIIEYLTRDSGLRSAFAKSPRKIKSRFGGSLEPFTHARISLLGKEDAHLPRLTQSDIIRPFQDLREDTAAYLAASEMAELALKLLPQREPGGRIFPLMLWALEHLESAGADPFVQAVFELRLLKVSGYAPSLKACVRCGAMTDRFHPLEGALICPRCRRTGGSVRLSGALMKACETLGGWPLQRVSRIKISAGLIKEIKDFLVLHLDARAAVSVRTRQFRAGCSRFRDSYNQSSTGCNRLSAGCNKRGARPD